MGPREREGGGVGGSQSESICSLQFMFFIFLCLMLISMQFIWRINSLSIFSIYFFRIPISPSHRCDHFLGCPNFQVCWEFLTVSMFGIICWWALVYIIAIKMYILHSSNSCNLTILTRCVWGSRVRSCVCYAQSTKPNG